MMLLVSNKTMTALLWYNSGKDCMSCRYTVKYLNEYVFYVISDMLSVLLYKSSLSGKSVTLF